MNFDLILNSPGLDDASDATASASGALDPGSAPAAASAAARRADTAAASSASTQDSLATGWLPGWLERREGTKDQKDQRRRRRRGGGKGDGEAKHLFPWVSDQWTDLSREQRRQNKRQGRLAPSARSSVYSTLKGICTLYGAQPGMYCSICEVVHSKSKALVDKETMEDTSGWVDGTLRANLKREKRLETKRLKQLQITRMARAADALKWRRRKREKRMQVDPGTFLNDYTDTGGGDVDPAMRKAIDKSMKNQGLSKREKRFRGKLPRRLPMLKFRTDPIRTDEELGGDFSPEKKRTGKRRRRQQRVGRTAGSFQYEL